MNQPIYTITRSFSKKIQIKQFEPEDYYCAATQEFFDEMPTEEEKLKVSQVLWNFCKEEVLKAVQEQVGALATQLESGEGPY